MLKHLITWILFFGVFFTTPALSEESPDELYRQGQFAQAEKAYARSDMDHPKDIRHRYNRGCAAYQNADYQGAVAAFASVLRRAENDETRSKAAYNLGNATYKQNDFKSAAAAYKQALLYNPASEDARHNLELTLRELEKRKKDRTEKPKKQPQKDSGQESSPSQDQRDDKGQTESVQEEKSKQKSPQDLSGDLKPLQDLPVEAGDKITADQTGLMLDRKKAEALLDNLKEDRSRFLRFQIPEEKKGGVQSGKDW
ncbi:tetratricopeptide repeat protein [Thermodesulfobacteriota bacterium]